MLSCVEGCYGRSAAAARIRYNFNGHTVQKYWGGHGARPPLEEIWWVVHELFNFPLLGVEFLLLSSATEDLRSGGGGMSSGEIYRISTQAAGWVSSGTKSLSRVWKSRRLIAWNNLLNPLKTHSWQAGRQEEEIIGEYQQGWVLFLKVLQEKLLLTNRSSSVIFIYLCLGRRNC